MKMVLTGDKDLIANIRKYGAQADEALKMIVMATAQDVTTHAIYSISRGTKTGKQYKRGKKMHRASAPGEAPARDGGRLESSIVADITGLTAEVSTNLQYAAPLEFGTVNMEPRPFLQPALDANKEKFKQRLMRLFDQASKGINP